MMTPRIPFLDWVPQPAKLSRNIYLDTKYHEGTSSSARGRQEVLNKEIILQEEHVEHLPVHNVGYGSLGLELLPLQEGRESLEVHPDRGHLGQGSPLAVVSAPGQ